MLFLEIIGGIVLFIIFAVVFIYFYFKYKFGKFLDVDPSKNYSPLSIHLNEDLFPKWLEDEKIKAMVSEIESHGFRSAKSYSIPEMGELQLLSFIKEPHTAVLYTHEIAGKWVDLYARGENGNEYTVTNVPIGGGIAHNPDNIKINLKDSNLDEMMKQFFDLTSEHSLKVIEEDEFRSVFENSYAKDIQWRNRNGGISYDEFLAIEKELPGKNSDIKIKEAFIEFKLQELEQWHDSIIDQYTELNNIEEGESYDLRYQSVIVPEKTDPVSYAHYLKDHGFINDNTNLDKLAEHFKGEANIGMIFNALNEKLSPDLRSNKGGSFKHPLPIDLYLIPERDY